MIDPNLTVAQIIEENQLFTQVIRRFEPFLSGIEQTIVEFCSQKHLNLEFFLEILSVFENRSDFHAENFRHYPVPVLIDYLRRTHAYYLDKRLYEIEQSVFQLTQHHQESNPLVILLSEFFKYYRKELQEHIQLEEESLFPYIEHLHNCQQTSNKRLEIPYSQQFSLKTFEALHDDEEEVKLALIREKILLFNPSITATLSYNVLLSQLETLEIDMHIHGLLEDHVLLPVAYEMEKSREN